MTSLTGWELKMVFFALIFLGLSGTIGALYSLDPIPTQSHNVEATIYPNNSTATSENSWMTSLMGVLPAPFDDPMLALVIAIFLTPVIVMVSYIAIRAIKDIVSQWL